MYTTMHLFFTNMWVMTIWGFQLSDYRRLQYMKLCAQPFMESSHRTTFLFRCSAADQKENARDRVSRARSMHQRDYLTTLPMTNRPDLDTRLLRFQSCHKKPPPLRARARALLLLMHGAACRWSLDIYADMRLENCSFRKDIMTVVVC